MQFDSFSAFISMGGHGVYVWSVYGATVIILLIMAANPLLKKRRFFIEQTMRLKREKIVREHNERQAVKEAD